MSTEKKDPKAPPEPPEKNHSEARPTGTAPVPHDHHVPAEPDDFGCEDHEALRSHLITDHPDECTTARRATLSWAKLSAVHAALHEAVALPPEVTSAEDLAAQLAGQAHAELEDAPVPGFPHLEPSQKAVFLDEPTEYSPHHYPHHHGHSMSYDPYSGQYINPWAAEPEWEPKATKWEGTISGHFQATQVTQEDPLGSHPWLAEDVVLKSSAPPEPVPEWTVQVLVSAVSVPLLAKAAVAEAVTVTGIKDGVVGNFKVLPGYLVHPVGTGTTTLTAEAASKGHLVYADITVGFYPATAYPTAGKTAKKLAKQPGKATGKTAASHIAMSAHAYESLRVPLLAAAKVLGVAAAHAMNLQELAERVSAEVIALDGTLDEALERMGFLAKLAGLPLAEKVTEAEAIVTMAAPPDAPLTVSHGHTELPELVHPPHIGKNVVVNPDTGLAVVLPEPPGTLTETQEEILAGLVSPPPVSDQTALEEFLGLEVKTEPKVYDRLSPDDALDCLHAGGFNAHDATGLLKQARAKAQGLKGNEVPGPVVTAVVTVTFLPFYDAFRVAWHG